ncbi:LamG-like jellyroll fold domain-containing protein [Verrucomicrobiaceae bacterium 227]
MDSTFSFSCFSRGIIAATALLSPSVSFGANYQDAVLKLSPSFYYQLNETTTADGAIDSTGNATAAGIFNGDYVNGLPIVGGPGPIAVFNPDNFDGTPVPGVGGELNLAHYSNNEGHITLGEGSLYGAKAMTVAFFFKAGSAQGGDRLFTNNLTDNTKSFQVVTANDGLVLAVDPGATGSGAERTLYMEDNSGPDRRLIDSEAGWFHVVASTEGATGIERANNLKLWINGVNRTENLNISDVGWGTDTGLAKIGGRRAEATDSTTHSGAQDEVAIWLDRVLTDAEAESLWEAAIDENTTPLTITAIDYSDGEIDHSVSITWNSRPGKIYGVYTTNQLDDSVWVELDDNIESDGDSTSFIEEGIPDEEKRRFYRVVEITP